MPGRRGGGLNTRLTVEEANGLKEYMAYLVRIGTPPSKRDIITAANYILERQGQLRVSKDWGRRWLHRNKGRYKGLRSKSLQAERNAVHQKGEIEAHFADFKSIIDHYHIQQLNVWNFDEIGFRIGCLRGRTVIVPADVKAICLADPDNRDSITSLECISADGLTIPSFLIMKGEVLLEKHFNNSIHDNTILASTTTGFTNDKLTYRWLEHFEGLTKPALRGSRWRLLVMDGHSSHLSEHFKWFAWTHQIVPFLLPSHSTHLLQPLDVGVF